MTAAERITYFITSFIMVKNIISRREAFDLHKMLTFDWKIKRLNSRFYVMIFC